MSNITYFEAFENYWAEDGTASGWEEEQYRTGWAVIGDDKPTVGQMNTTHQLIDRKANWLYRQLKHSADERSLSVEESDEDVLERILANQLNAMWPVGSVYTNAVSDTNPSAFLPGTWEKMTSGFLYPHGSPNAGSAGSTGGVTSVTLTESQIPAHNHSSTSAGGHTHTGTTSGSGNHSHTRGTMEIGGAFTAETRGAQFQGVFYEGIQVSAETSAPGGSIDNLVEFRASRNWTGSTSASGTHTHSFTTSSAGSHNHEIGSTGGGQSHTNMPPYITVYMYRRIS